MGHVFKKEDIEILVATMHRESDDFLKAMFPFTDLQKLSVLVVNQTEEGRLLVSGLPNVRVVNSLDKGLSKSRNLALQNAKGRLCVIADDDVVFAKDFEAHIVNAFNATPDAALVSFRAEKAPGVIYKAYPRERKINPGYFGRLDIMSVEMVVNREMIIAHYIAFNENFGLGAKFGMGEEALFVDAIFRQKLKIVMEPQVISGHPAETTNSKISLADKYYIQGALYSELFKGGYLKWVLFKIFFQLKQGTMKFSEVSTAIKAAKQGRKALLAQEGRTL